jgi:enterochelin esterase-like enzyme
MSATKIFSFGAVPFAAISLAAIPLAAIAVGSQQPDKTVESPRLAAVQRAIAAGDAAAQDSFWTSVARSGAPIIESVPGKNDEVLATFVWKDGGQTKNVIMNARLNSLDPPSDPRSRMQRLAGSNIWYLSHRFPKNAEVLYQLMVDPPAESASASALQQSARLDPLNSSTYPDRSDPLFDSAQPWRNGSIARMPAVADNRWLAKRADVPAGAMHEHTVKSAVLTMANPRKVWVYTTPGTRLEHPNVLILFDGGTTYQSRIPTTTILDNLYAEHKIGPTVAIFVDNGGVARSLDMNFSDAFVWFLTDELLPWVQREYNFKADPARTVLGGDSLCGLIGAYAALRRPDVFGKVLSQSGAFQLSNKKDADGNEPEWIARQFARVPKSSVSFYLEVGQLEDRPEGNGGTSLLAANRHLRDILALKGYAVRYVEVYADHDPVHWRRTLPDALIATLGT